MPTTSLTLIPSDAVFAQNDDLVTTSTKVADAFGKRHSHVLRKLESLECSSDFTSAHFWVHVQKIDIGHGAKRESKIYQMTKDGFMFLVMGFTGKKAAAIKEAYIKAFNDMAAKLYPVLSNQTITPSQQSEIRQLIGSVAKQFEQPEQHAMYSRLYGRLKAHFKVAKYDQIPSAEFDKAITFLEEQKRLIIEPTPFSKTLQHIAMPKVPHLEITITPASYMRDLAPSPIGALLNQLLQAEQNNQAVTLENIATACKDYQSLITLIRQQQIKLQQIEALMDCEFKVTV